MSSQVPLADRLVQTCINVVSCSVGCGPVVTVRMGRSCQAISFNCSLKLRARACFLETSPPRQQTSDAKNNNDLVHFHAWCSVYARGRVVLTTTLVREDADHAPVATPRPFTALCVVNDEATNCILNLTRVLVEMCFIRFIELHH